MRTEPFLENSQTIALELPDMRHLPTMSLEGPPQPAIAQSKTARATIRNGDLCLAKINGMITGILYCAGVIGTTHNPATRFLAINPSFLWSHSTGQGQKARSGARAHSHIL